MKAYSLHSRLYVFAEVVDHIRKFRIWIPFGALDAAHECHREVLSISTSQDISQHLASVAPSRMTSQIHKRFLKWANGPGLLIFIAQG